MKPTRVLPVQSRNLCSPINSERTKFENISLKLGVYTTAKCPDTECCYVQGRDLGSREARKRKEIS